MDRLEEIKETYKNMIIFDWGTAVDMDWLVDEIEQLRKALWFYAKGKHFNLSTNEIETGAVALKALREGK